MSSHDAELLVLLLGMVPVYALVGMCADFHHPSRRDWLLAITGSAIALAAALVIVVRSASGSSVGWLIVGATLGLIFGLYENSKGPEGSSWEG